MKRSWVNEVVAVFAIVAMMVAAGGCSGSSSSSSPTEGGGDSSSGDAPEFVGSMVLVFEDPGPQQVVSGVQRIVVSAQGEAAELAQIVSVELQKIVVEDVDPRKHRFEGQWDTTQSANGPTTLRAVATLDSGAMLFAEQKVVVYNPRSDELTGSVWLTGPVRGATVDLFAVDLDLSAVTPIGSAETDEDGAFAISLEAPVPASIVLLRAWGFGATYSLADGTTETLGDKAPLTLLWNLDGSYPPEQLVLSAWTTMGTALARAYRQAYGNWSAEQCLRTAYDRLGEHMWRDSPNAVLEFTVPVLPDSNGFQTGLTAGLNGITHLGLAEVAQEWSAEAGEPITLAEVANALAHDLTDTYFDGLRTSDAPGGGGVGVDVRGLQPLDADTTRGRLAQACYRATAPYGAAVDQTALFAPAGLYENLAQDDGPLYRPDSGTASAVEPEPPTVAFVAPTPADGSSVAQSFEIAVSAKDNAGLVSAALSVDGVPLIEWAGSDAPASIQESWSVHLDEWPAQDVAQTYRIDAKDLEGVAVSKSRTIWLDRQGPVLSLDSPADGGATNSYPIVFDGDASDAPNPNGKLTIAVFPGQTNQNAPAGAANQVIYGAGAFSVPVTPDGEGTKNYVVRATDPAGHAANIQVQVTYDVTPPGLTLDDVEMGEGAWTDGAHLVLTGTAFDLLSGLAELTAKSGSQTLSVPIAGKAETPWQLAIPATPIATKWTVRARDRAGNASPPFDLFVGHDDEPPVLTWELPAADPIWTNAAHVVLAGTAFDAGSGVKQVFVRVNGGVGVAVDSLSGSDTPGLQSWTHTVHLPTNGETAIEGSYSLEVYAVDFQGASSSKIARELHVDVTKPSIVLKGGPAFVSEESCAVTSLGTVECPDTDGVALDLQERCDDNHCGVLAKFPHRWGHDAPQKSEWTKSYMTDENWPVVSVGTAEPPATLASLSRQFVFPGLALGPWEPVSELGYVPLVLPEFAPGQTWIPQKTTPFPVALKLRAIDLAGNVAERTLDFDLRVIAPIPHTTWVAPEQPSVDGGGTWSFLALTAHRPFAPKIVPEYAPLALGTFVATNPFNYTISVQFEPSTVAGLVVEAVSQRRWGPAKTEEPPWWPGYFPCEGGLGHCVYWTEMEPSDYSLWSDFPAYLLPAGPGSPEVVTSDHCAIVQDYTPIFQTGPARS